jgi:phage-related protein
VAIIGILNCLVSADVSAYEGGLAKAEKRTGQFRAAVDKQSQGINQALGTLGNVSGTSGLFSSITGPIASAASSAKSVISGLTASIGAGMAAVVGTVALAGAAFVGLGVSILYMSYKGEQAILAMRSLAQELGATMEQMSTLGTFGGEGLAHAMIHFQRGIEDGSEHLSRALSKMNLSPEQFKGLDFAQQIRLFTQGFAGLQTQGERSSVAMASFGRQGLHMIEDLRRGTAGLDAAAAKAQRFGQIITDAQADAVRAANKEWKGFGMALDGIGKQAAAMLAPVWGAIGKVGGDIGAKLVQMFQQAQPYLEEFGSTFASTFAPIWSTISNIASTFMNVLQSAIPLVQQLGLALVANADAWLSIYTPISFYSKLFEGAGTSITEGFRTAFTWGKIGLEVVTSAFESIARMGKTIQEFFADVLRAVAVGLARTFNQSALADWFKSMGMGWDDVKTYALTGLAVMKVGLDTIGTRWAQVIDLIKLKWLELQRTLGVSGLDRQIQDLSRSVNQKEGDFRAAIRAQVRQWEFELAGGLLRAGNQAAAIVQALGNTQVGQLKATTDHGAVTRESEKAFSMLNSTRGVQDYYQRLMADQQRDANGLLRDIRGEIRNAPAIRRARL